jgi:hypothetical protein
MFLAGRNKEPLNYRQETIQIQDLDWLHASPSPAGPYGLRAGLRQAANASPAITRGDGGNIPWEALLALIRLISHQNLKHQPKDLIEELCRSLLLGLKNRYVLSGHCSAAS